MKRQVAQPLEHCAGPVQATAKAHNKARQMLWRSPHYVQRQVSELASKHCAAWLAALVDTKIMDSSNVAAAVKQQQ
jgi:hypothetical protein